MIRHASIIPYVERYRDLTTEPLRVTLRLRSGARVVHYDAPTIDGILSWAVVHEATRGCGLPALSEPYLLPLPLRALWQSPGGLPLWAATPLVAVDGVSDTVWEAKRPQSGRFTKTRSGRLMLTPQAGRWRERLTPRPAVVAREWVGYCVGDADEIMRLLGTVEFIGKRRAVGFGEVESWTVEPAEFALVRDGALARSLPALAADLLGDEFPLAAAVRVAWTPPYWLRSVYLPGWPLGTKLEAGNGIQVGAVAW